MPSKVKPITQVKFNQPKLMNYTPGLASSYKNNHNLPMNTTLMESDFITVMNSPNSQYTSNLD